MAKDIDIIKLKQKGLVDIDQLRQEATKRGLIDTKPASKPSRILPAHTDETRFLGRRMIPEDMPFNTPKQNLDELTSLASGFSGGLSDYLAAYINQRMGPRKISVGDLVSKGPSAMQPAMSFKDSLSDVRSGQTLLPKIVGSFAPTSIRRNYRAFGFFTKNCYKGAKPKRRRAYRSKETSR